MELRPGYKQTEVGMIPEDWQVETLARVCEPKGIVRGPFGGALKKETFVPTGFKVYEQRNAIYKSCAAGSYFIDQSKYSEMQRFRVAPGDFIVSCSGTIGCIYMLPQDAPEGVINQALLKLRINSAVAATEFFYAYFGWENFQAEIVDSTQGGAMKNLVGMHVFKNTPIALPPLAEQNAIASALSDLNAQLSSLDDLLCKKRNIKQAAMQELLTGKRRLPGFEGEWEATKLGDVANIKTGSRNNEDKNEDGEYPFFVRSDIVEKINSYSYDCEAILVPGEGRIGEIFHYVNGRFDVHQRVYAITQFKAGLSGKFVHSYMAMNFGSWAMQNTVKATVDSLRLPTFQTFEMLVPPTEDEQIAIAAVLCEMDAELAALETRRDKTRDLKQAMMQELLTGRIRLV